MYTQCAAACSLDYESSLLLQARMLTAKGLQYEAMYLLLKDKKVQQQLMGAWSEY